MSIIETGSTRKYLLYAVGEIFLVVIGIMIALQINNWNTKRQEFSELQTYLESIKTNLNDDLISIREIKDYRDSTIENSKKYMKLTLKEEFTGEEFLNIISSPNNVFFDKFFQPRSSGFEALKASGYIRLLNGSNLEKQLNSYYYTVDKIRERENSLNHTTETMENLAFDKNVLQRMSQLALMVSNNKRLSTSELAEIKKVLNHPNLTAAHARNAAESILTQFYLNAEELAMAIIREIDENIKDD